MLDDKVVQGPNSVVPLVPIDLDKRRHLKVTLSALRAVERATGKNMLEGGNINLSGATAEIVTALLWALLKHEDPALTLDAVGDMVTLANFEDVSRRIGIAFVAHTPQVRDALMQGVDPKAIPIEAIVLSMHGAGGIQAT